MSAAIAMNVPGGRPLVGWWRELSAFEPSRLWFAHLVLHRLELLVESDSASSIETLADALAGSIQARPAPVDLGPLREEVRLEPALFERLLDHLIRTGTLSLDTEGRASISRQEMAPATCLRQRRALDFTDGAPPYFLPLTGSASFALMPPAGWSFDVRGLEHLAAKSLAWRQTNHFPTDIRRFLLPGDLSEPTRADAVIVDRAEQALLGIIQAGDQLLGFAVSPDGWEIQKSCVLTLPIASDFGQAL